MRTVDPGDLYQLGQTQAVVGGSNPTVVILDFGQPDYENGQYGAYLFGDGGFADKDNIGYAVVEYVRGFIEHRTSETPYLFVIVGVSSYTGSIDQVNNAHGRAWADELNLINLWLVANDYGSLVDVEAGADIETGDEMDDADHDWATAAEAKAWTDGFHQVSDGPGYINFGDAGGCPSDPAIQSPPGGDCNRDWTRDSIYYVSSGNLSAFVALPEIYDRDGVLAAQWHSIFYYARSQASSSYPVLLIGGALTQRQKCLEDLAEGRPDCIEDQLDNPAAPGYDQLYRHFFSGLNPYPQPMSWSTDLTGRAIN